MPPKLKDGVPTKRLELVVPETWTERLDEWRAKQRPIPNRSEAIRMLVERALEATARK